MPLVSEVHVDAPLSNMAVEYRNKKFIGTDLVPPVKVAKKADKYYIFDKKDRFTAAETIRGPKAKANEVDWSVSTSTYGCIDHALAEFLPDSVVANADQPIQPRRRTVEFLTDLILLKLEIVLMTLATTYANYGSGYRIQLSGDDQLDSYATSDPIGVIDTGKAACFVEPNTIAMGKEVFDALKRHPQLLDHVKGGATTDKLAKINEQVMAEIFEVDRVLVGKAKRNTANIGQTASYSYIWGKDIVLAYVDPNPSIMGVCWAKLFTWIQMVTGESHKVRTWRDESRGGGGEQIEVETSYDEKVICSDVAYLIDTAIS